MAAESKTKSLEIELIDGAPWIWLESPCGTHRACISLSGLIYDGKRGPFIEGRNDAGESFLFGEHGNSEDTPVAPVEAKGPYSLEDDGGETYLDGCESRFTIRGADGEGLAWVCPCGKDSGEAAAREMIRLLNASQNGKQGDAL